MIYSIDSDDINTSASLASDTGYESSESNSEISSQATRRKEIRRKISVHEVGGDNVNNDGNGKNVNNSVDNVNTVNNVNNEDSTSSEDNSSDETDGSGSASSHSSSSETSSESYSDGSRHHSDWSSDSDGDYRSDSGHVVLTKEDLASNKGDLKHDEEEGSDDVPVKNAASNVDANNSESNDTGKEKYYSDSSALDAFADTKAREPETAYPKCR